MAYEIGVATNSYDLVAKLHTFLTQTLPVGQRWTSLDSVLTGGPLNTNGEHHVRWKAPGLSGTEEIFCGVATHKSVASDYYNLSGYTGTGYVPGTGITGRSGNYGACCWNQPTPYWFVANGQRVIAYWKTQTQYDSLYLGKFFPYGTPQQYPYPVLVGATLNGAAATRYSDTTRFSWWKGNLNQCRMRFVDGSWRMPYILPFTEVSRDIPIGSGPPDQSSYYQLTRNTPLTTSSAEGYYSLKPLILYDANNIYGELDGLYHISGFNNAVENTILVNGVTYVVLRDIARTGFYDYVALRLQ